MFLIVAIVVLIFAPDPWNLVGFLVALGLFLAEVAYWTRAMRRRRVQTGAETLLGRRGTVVRQFDRAGQVRLEGESEIWSARTLEGAPVDGAITVVGVDGISLVVEPARELGGRRARRPRRPGRRGRRSRRARDHERCRAPGGRVEPRRARSVQARRDELAGRPRAVAAERHAEDRADAAGPVGAERPVAGEGAEAVGDQPSAIPLEPAEDVRAVADHEIRAGLDDRMGERPEVAAVLAQVGLGAVRDVAALSLGARVHRHDDVRPAVGQAHGSAAPAGSSTPPFSPAYGNPTTDTRTSPCACRVA